MKIKKKIGRNQEFFFLKKIVIVFMQTREISRKTRKISGKIRKSSGKTRKIYGKIQKISGKNQKGKFYFSRSTSAGFCACV